MGRSNAVGWRAKCCNPAIISPEFTRSKGHIILEQESVGKQGSIACRLSIWYCLLMASALHAQMSDKEVFGVINQEYPGLEAVKSALSAGDTSLAEKELLRYFQYRTSVKYFELSAGGSVTDAEDNRNHYFTVVGIRKYAGAADGTIDWTTRDAQDNEWHWQFHRMYWLTNYGKVYASTRDEKYATACVADILDWIKDNPSGYPRTLDTGIRLWNWVEAYQYFVAKYRSPSVSSEAHITILKSLISQCLFLRDNWRSDGNWGASETQGLCAVVTVFPELTFSANTAWVWWKDLVVSRLQHHLSTDFYPDGVQVETSPMYACLEYRNLFLAYKLMSLNSIKVSDNLKNMFIKPLEYMMHIHKPDGYLTQLSDADRTSYLSYLKEGAQLFDRQDMLYAATKGAEGIRPQNTFASFPFGGVFVMRSDWGSSQLSYPNTKYLVFDMSSNEPSHAHSDILTFEAYVNGKLLVRDPGRYTYVAGSWRDYFKGTAGHNTLVVDNKDQKQRSSGTAEYWSSSPGYDYVLGSHQAYSGLKVQRSVFFAKPEYWIITDLVTGTGQHTYDVYFHLDALYNRSAAFDSVTHAVTTPQFGLFTSDSSVETQIISGWVSDDYNVKSEAPIVKQKRVGVTPVTFESVLYPFTSVKMALSVEKEEVLNGYQVADNSQAISLRIKKGDKEDWFFRSNLEETILTYGPFRCNAKAAFVGLSADGKVLNLQIVGGSLMYKGDVLLCDTKGKKASISYYQNAVFVQSEDIQYVKIWAAVIDSLVLNGNNVHALKLGDYLVYGNLTNIEECPWSYGSVENFRLEQNYPNPFNPTTTIVYSIPATVAPPTVFVQVKVFDILGREVALLVSGDQSAGTYRVQFNGSNLSSGVYYYVLHAGSYSEIKPMILMR